ncbi:molybdenum transport protein [Desulfofundulus australicus DSM 11792]|uniref:Putative pyrophosphorylase ModD n=1 Tax=Desulfofundulus australicus DSM 11792 TaxID=1121425 RepID=A0A1M4Z2W3_9FIRM|nr:ModD protein [Desulfofundulus australicus]SHF12399.1 molybdenum transport protein [Desulfofundulus australicus DSM 11792]
MFYIPDERIEEYIKENVPYLDLTTLVLGIGNRKGKMSFYSREEAVLCGTEEVIRLCDKLGSRVLSYFPSGSVVKPNETFLEVEGKAEELHAAWKVSLNILEYCSGIATRTRRMVDIATKINPRISIVTTRKIFPGTKELATKAVVVGGGFPHRLGLSETILIFKQHLSFLGGLSGLLEILDEIRTRACEKKVIVEVENLEDALALCKGGVDGIQFDKVSPPELKSYVPKIRGINPAVILLAAGGINLDNVADYAKTGVDALVTTSVYFGKPVDLSVKMIEL